MCPRVSPLKVMIVADAVGWAYGRSAPLTNLHGGSMSWRRISIAAPFASKKTWSLWLLFLFATAPMTCFSSSGKYSPESLYVRPISNSLKWSKYFEFK